MPVSSRGRLYNTAGISQILVRYTTDTKSCSHHHKTAVKEVSAAAPLKIVGQVGDQIPGHHLLWDGGHCKLPLCIVHCKMG